MEDLFGSAHDLEQTHFDEGASEGREAGKRLGMEEGRQLGLQKGFEIGVEVGHYAGFVRVVRKLQEQQPGTIPSRIDRNLSAMEECLLQFPMYDPLDEGIHDLLEALRGKYKAVTAALGKQQGAADTPASAAQQQQRQQQQQDLTF